ncbi:hypothetical protein [Mucilaginibacter ginsenosidivorans]|uniref:Uncharacterized protein n=1 Tax=Mucilaginibacter ginsenosidivorans TaxID=398053 RepID=A0A5B8USY5_9SPHI|nr:hypothetical protein [Mucilaginibacter ginsenosidivorans]QEC61556.1 hypothetical protein FRZ54_02795 [Mucilaginibacter ginsenosidivorans]
MKKYLLSAAVVLAMCATFGFKVDGSHLKGYIDDSHCAGSKTPMCTPATRVHCAQECIKGGASAVLVVGDKIYKIANQKAVLKYAGKNVTVDGTVTDDTIQVTKITETKS